jgi:hypothetical protein
VCMCVCVYVCMCVCVYVCMCGWMCLCLRMCLYAYVFMYVILAGDQLTVMTCYPVVTVVSMVMHATARIYAIIVPMT